MRNEKEIFRKSFAKVKTFQTKGKTSNGKQGVVKETNK